MVSVDTYPHHSYFLQEARPVACIYIYCTTIHSDCDVIGLSSYPSSNPLDSDLTSRLHSSLSSDISESSDTEAGPPNDADDEDCGGTNLSSASETSLAESSDTDAPLLIAVIGVLASMTAVNGVRPTGVSSPSPSSRSVVLIVHSHFRFFSLRLRFLVPGVSRSLSAIRRLISSKGPGVCPPSRVSSPVYAIVTSSGSSSGFSAARSGSMAE